MKNSTSTSMEYSFSKVERRKPQHSQTKKHVSFEMVTIRSHERILGDHPKCKHGPPIALGWNTIDQDVSYDFEDYQQHYHRASPKRCFKLSPQEREELLSFEGEDEQDYMNDCQGVQQLPTSKQKLRKKKASAKRNRRNSRSKHSLPKPARRFGRPRLWIPEVHQCHSEFIDF
mmetsp:Transcript_19510/g.23424  ORF Transcript_19510/g.23424 Transcript_19510/m.23424 type:complete len:173 (+) Transcript_19510:24-542(+)